MTSRDPQARRDEGRGRPLPRVRGRGASRNPENRFRELDVVPDEPRGARGSGPRTRYLRDASRSIVATNDSPDVGFDASVNPYRGCEHGCVYCYARPGHEYLGLSSGLDFETKIFVKEEAPALLREELAAPGWEPRAVAMSGVTDPYQPVERELEITRGCLEVLAEFRNPVSMISKNHMITRDADLLGELASHDAAAASLSVTTLDPEVRRLMEPRTSSPRRRLRAMEELAEAGVRVGVLVAPVIPGLTDHEMPRILEAAAEAGATRASYILLRLPHAVEELFVDWLETNFPDRREKVLGRLRELRGGELYDATYGRRMRGEGPFADQIRDMFDVACRRLGLNREDRPLSTDAFRRPGDCRQTELFP